MVESLREQVRMRFDEAAALDPRLMMEKLDTIVDYLADISRYLKTISDITVDSYEHPQDPVVPPPSPVRMTSPLASPTPTPPPPSPPLRLTTASTSPTRPPSPPLAGASVEVIDSTIIIQYSNVLPNINLIQPTPETSQKDQRPVTQLHPTPERPSGSALHVSADSNAADSIATDSMAADSNAADSMAADSIPVNPDALSANSLPVTTPNPESENAAAAASHTVGIDGVDVMATESSGAGCAENVGVGVDVEAVVEMDAAGAVTREIVEEDDPFATDITVASVGDASSSAFAIPPPLGPAAGTRSRSKTPIPQSPGQLTLNIPPVHRSRSRSHTRSRSPTPTPGQKRKASVEVFGGSKKQKM